MGSARIQSGVCDRISPFYKSGSGDNGTSNLVAGSICSKDSPASVFFNLNWRLMIAIDKFLIEAWYIDEVEKQALKWFRRNLFSLNSYVYLAGDTEKHVFPKECLDFMNRYIKEAGKEIGGAKDFIIWDNQYGVLIQELIVPAREMDVAFESIKNAGLIPSGDETRLIASIINRLSAWFFWMGRRIYKRLNIEENYWQGKIEAFPELYKD